MKIEVHKITSPEELETAFSIRRTVFVEEQKVSEREEYDEFEVSSSHYLATFNGNPVGVARWRKTEKGIKLERFAVLKPYRSCGVGTALVNKLLSEIPQHITPVYLHAQLTAVPLYKKCGFIEVGDQFSEADILHYKMILKK